MERLHIYGDEHPETGLKNKVVGFQFSQKIPVIDPVTKEAHQEQVKQLMVNQLKLTLERDRLILSPFDDTLHKQLVDYSVERITQAGLPVYTSKNEHFVDALGLAHLAFVLKFPDLTGAIKEVQNSSIILTAKDLLTTRDANAALRSISLPTNNPWKDIRQVGKEPGERPGDYQKWVKVPMGGRQNVSVSTWGSRGGYGGEGRSMW